MDGLVHNKLRAGGKTTVALHCTACVIISVIRKMEWNKKRNKTKKCCQILPIQLDCRIVAFVKKFGEEIETEVVEGVGEGVLQNFRQLWKIRPLVQIDLPAADHNLVEGDVNVGRLFETQAALNTLHQIFGSHVRVRSCTYIGRESMRK